MSYNNGLDKPSNYFSTKLYTGTGATHNITGVGFQPDWVWLKYRSSADSHALYDSVRGTQKILQSDRTNAEITQTNGLSSFDSDGFTIGDNSQINTSSGTYVSWNWKAGTSVSGTTTGSGTSKAYSGSVSTDAGFSIIKYIGNGTAGHQIPHHLNAVPKMLILKNVTGGDENWFVYHASLGNTKDIHLNTTGASATADSWNNTTPSTTTWTMSDQSAINSTDGNDHIAYCFAEKKGFSKFGSYTGVNSITDNSFIYLGFSPAWVMIKKTNGVNDWGIFDNKRNSFNPTGLALDASNNNAESVNGTIDMLSNGFKVRSDSGLTGDGEYIYMAFAESPFVTGASAIPTTAR